MKRKLSVLMVLLFCKIAGIAQIPGWAWENCLTGTADHYSNFSVVADATGNIYVIGSFSSSTMNFGAISLTNAGVNDIFIAKYNPSGSIIWAKRIGGTGDDQAGGISIDHQSNIYITGSFKSPSLNIGSTSLTNDSAGTFDLFIAKYDSSGIPVWSMSAGSKKDDGSLAIHADSSGNAYITGYFCSPKIIFGGDTLILNGTYYNIFTVKYSTSGSLMWGRSTGGFYGAVGTGIATDRVGNVYISAYYGNSFAFGSTFISHYGSWDTFVGKYDAAGNPLWGVRSGGTTSDRSSGIVSDADGNVYITGVFDSPSMAFDTTTITNHLSPYYDIFVAGYDSAGNIRWAKDVGGGTEDIGSALAIDPSGNVYVTGYFTSYTLSSGPLSVLNSGATGTADLFVAKYDNMGNDLWIKEAGGTDWEEGYGITCDASGNLYAIGTFYSPYINFDHDTLNASGGDIFLAKLSSTVTTINELKSENQISTYPNPLKEKITVSVNMENGFFEVFDVTGKLLMKDAISSSKFEIDLSRFNNGIYFLTVSDHERQYHRKIIKE